MRILNIVCGLAVLLNSLHLAHFIHHFYSLEGSAHTAEFLGGLALAALVAILSFIGGCLLLKRAA